MIKNRVCVDTSVAERNLLRRKHNLFAWKWWQGRNKIEKLPLLQAPRSSVSAMSQLESTVFALADRHQGYERMNTSL